MELSELNADERTALVGLVKTIVMSDGNVSEDELEEVEQIVAGIGEEVYEASLDAFESRFLDEASFKKFLAGITRPEARDLIYGTILEAASADAIEVRESELLDWLAKTWNIEVKFDESEEGGEGD